MSFALDVEQSMRSFWDTVLDGALASRSVRAAAYRRLARNGSLVFHRVGDHDLVVDPADPVGRTVLETGSVGRDRTEAVCRRAAALGRGRTVLEIGANIGARAVHVVRSGLFNHVVCLKPDPRNLEFLRLNIEINRLAPAVRVLPVAAGAVGGMKTLRRGAGNPGGGTLRMTNLPLEVGSEVAVRVVTVDSLVDRGELNPEQIGLIWMETEGFEHEVLSACTHLLARRTPLVLGFTPAFYRTEDREEMLHALFSMYGSVSLIEPDGFTPLTHAQSRRLGRRSDLFCC